MPRMSRVEKAACCSGPWRGFARRAVLPWALQDAQLRGHVLEIGAGSGAMAAELLKRMPGITMCVTDFDESMVATAATKLGRYAGRATARQADATALPFGDATFDGVLSWIMLHHTVAWEKALAEAVRVLRPDGLLLGYDLAGGGPTRLVRHAADAGHRMVGAEELRAELARLPLVDASVRQARGGVVMRFRARRAWPTADVGKDGFHGLDT